MISSVCLWLPPSLLLLELLIFITGYWVFEVTGTLKQVFLDILKILWETLNACFSQAVIKTALDHDCQKPFGCWRIFLKVGSKRLFRLANVNE